MNRPILQFLVAILISTGCKENFEPPVIQQGVTFLVVDGFINNSSDTTFIRLSHTSKLSDGVRNALEKGAQLYLENSTGTTLYNFQEQSDSGKYFVPGMNLDVNQEYRLRIITANGKQYVSDEIPVVKTPEIDSISFGRMNKNFAVYANTHDPDNKTWYYRWEYTETWQYQAAYFSGLMVVNGGITDRPADKYVYECWKTQQNTQLLLGSSAKLKTDVIYNFPVRTIDLNSIELSIKYFISLHQYALTKEAYEYMDNLKKITEQTGTLFDPQPSQITGNIHSVNNPDEPVLGYIIASTPTTKELYITNAEVQPWNYDPQCSLIDIPIADVSGAFSEESLVPLAWDGSPLNPKGVFATTHVCGDCTALGGVTLKPVFWQ